MPSGILIHPAIWPQQLWPKIGGSGPFLGRCGWVPIYHKWAETYLRTNGILMHPAVFPFSGGSWVAIEHKVAWAEETSTASGILVHPAV